MRFELLAALVVATAMPHIASSQQAAAAGGSLSVEVDGVTFEAGSVRVSLCGDSRAQFPGSCVSYGGAAPARRGSVEVTIAGVPPGRYAVQAFHDANGNGRPDIPPEGYAFGNGAPFPPTFDAASITVTAGENHAKLSMHYAGGAPPAATQGSRGAEPTEGIRRTDLREGGLYGELYEQVGGESRRHAAVMLIGGSEGGLDTMSQLALSFAQAGYPALALAYWGERELPQQLQGIPLEYFDQGLAWLARRPSVDPKAIGLLGWSRGAEAALLVGTRNPSVHAVIAVAPSSIVWQGMGKGPGDHAAWTAGGKVLPFVTPDASRYRPNGTFAPMFEARLAEADAHPETAIPVEKLRAPLLLISGSDDGVWPSRRFADRIVARLQGAHHRYPVRQLDYTGAGHFILVGPADSMLSRMAAAASRGVMGGTEVANDSAWKDNWPRTLAFLADAFPEKQR